MKTRITRFGGWAGGIAAAAVLALGASPVQAMTAEEILMYKGPDRTEVLLKGARKEGRMTIYSSLIVN
ncbi:MAG TPA: hypothetical protein VLN73_00285, partial [Alphaproteobacteria bacterium]|nr:hypothetical protein [Alphaproteobacteria bacterium]